MIIDRVQNGVEAKAKTHHHHQTLTPLNRTVRGNIWGTLQDAVCHDCLQIHTNMSNRKKPIDNCVKAGLQ